MNNDPDVSVVCVEPEEIYPEQLKALMKLDFALARGSCGFDCSSNRLFVRAVRKT